MSREGSPDWLRTFQVPTTESVLSISSASESSLKEEHSVKDNSDGRELSPAKSMEVDDDDDDEVIGKFIGKSVGSPSDKKLKGKSPKKGENVEEHVPQKKKKSDGSKKREGKTRAVIEKPSEPQELNETVLALSSDSDPGNSPPREDGIHGGESSDLKMSQLQSGDNSEDALMGSSEESPSKQATKGKPSKKSPKSKGQTLKKDKKKIDNEEGISGDADVPEKEASDKQIEPRVSSSTLPLVLSEKVQRTKALVECEKDSIDLSGDMGAVGRVIVSESRSGNSEMCLDLKGTVYKTTIVPSRTFCVVSFGPSEAKIEAIMNDFIQLKPETYEAETMVEGTLEGFLFDSEDEADKVPKTAPPHQADKNDDTEEQTNGTTQGKAQKASKIVKKRDKPAGGKPQPPKKARKKTQVSKKPKSKN
ncbi:DNA-binding protein BIN4 [Argentina anserina]|uniref:DNA-binding protein BIN4 n=1 Tax=Argentina anserina TaxID=57926 RepID=UPI00217665E1|nr:DNA-binding protein BIN4 [Potentilla anserina]